MRGYDFTKFSYGLKRLHESSNYTDYKKPMQVAIISYKNILPNTYIFLAVYEYLGNLSCIIPGMFF